MRYLLLVILLLFPYASAQGNDGILSFIDTEGGGRLLGTCVGAEPDARACVPNVEVIPLEAFYTCVERGLAGCERKLAYPVPFAPEVAGDSIDESIERAWTAFVDRAIDEIGDRINELPPCWVPTPCPPQVDWTCIANRVTEALTTAYDEYLPRYWESVYEGPKKSAVRVLQ